MSISSGPYTVSGANIVAPVDFAIVGLAHDHAATFLTQRGDWKSVRLVGIVEADPSLVARHLRRFKLDPGLFASTLKELLKRTRVQAVAAFGNTLEHLRVVEECAVQGIHVMVEKPLAVNLEQAQGIARAAKAGGIQVFVNYITTWSAGIHAARALIHNDGAIGEIRKIMVYAGHPGSKIVGCSAEFIAWVTDPERNGGGALNDFGCYGVDLATWLMGGQRPLSVFAVTQQIRPDLYPAVEDEATIVLTYPGAQAIIQASWHSPFNRKDLEVYGQTGYVAVPRPSLLKLRKRGEEECEITPLPLKDANADPLSHLAAVVRGSIAPADLASLEMNLLVVEILDAAHESARLGRRIYFPDPGANEVGRFGPDD